ncbi:hypothetical protein FAIPA1_680002 [Frankia sp. AiPs1]|uniref:polymorphic toxin type 24 domain-containing protein n=1 Tax=Frankia sp. AiPa1 TaxID=573492 RepID=UPI00202B8425|nr:polymorphic toxin type 24 domain-containing protein [Frankia sp. AiPa1]MCL9758973.1 polymorphic toxin type 24 domain-containing protein [Frankia sp. AiPa1]
MAADSPTTTDAPPPPPPPPPPDTTTQDKAAALDGHHNAHPSGPGDNQPAGGHTDSGPGSAQPDDTGRSDTDHDQLSNIPGQETDSSTTARTTTTQDRSAALDGDTALADDHGVEPSGHDEMRPAGNGEHKPSEHDVPTPEPEGTDSLDPTDAHAAHPTRNAIEDKAAALDGDPLPATEQLAEPTHTPESAQPSDIDPQGLETPPQMPEPTPEAQTTFDEHTTANDARRADTDTATDPSHDTEPATLPNRTQTIDPSNATESTAAKGTHAPDRGVESEQLGDVNPQDLPAATTDEPPTGASEIADGPGLPGPEPDSQPAESGLELQEPGREQRPAEASDMPVEDTTAESASGDLDPPAGGEGLPRSETGVDTEDLAEDPDDQPGHTDSGESSDAGTTPAEARPQQSDDAQTDTLPAQDTAEATPSSDHIDGDEAEAAAEGDESDDAPNGPLPDSARQHSGRFPERAGANDILYRASDDGTVTNYQVYDEDGLPVKRVDLQGRPHAGIPTPHVVEYNKHTNPSTGEIFVRPSRMVRPAENSEIP